MRHLRYLWFQPRDATLTRVLLEEDEARALAAKVACLCLHLQYVRVVDWAWTIGVRDGKKGLPELLAVKDVEATMPGVFKLEELAY